MHVCVCMSSEVWVTNYFSFEKLMWYPWRWRSLYAVHAHFQIRIFTEKCMEMSTSTSCSYLFCWCLFGGRNKQSKTVGQLEDTGRWASCECLPFFKLDAKPNHYYLWMRLSRNIERVGSRGTGVSVHVSTNWKPHEKIIIIYLSAYLIETISMRPQPPELSKRRTIKYLVIIYSCGWRTNLMRHKIFIDSFHMVMASIGTFYRILMWAEPHMPSSSSIHFHVTASWWWWWHSMPFRGMKLCRNRHQAQRRFNSTPALKFLLTPWQKSARYWVMTMSVE